MTGSKIPFVGRRSATLLAAAAAFLMTLSAPRAQDHVGWAWVNPVGQGATFTPQVQYQYSSSGAAITVTRVTGTQHSFLVAMPGLGSGFGVPQAVAYGGNHTAIVTSWVSFNSNLLIGVAVYDPSGAPAADGRFAVRYRDGGDPAARQAYVFADDPTRQSYTPPPQYSWNGNRADPTITKLGVGRYRVVLPGLANGNAGEAGNVQVTPYLMAPLRAKVEQWSDSGNDLHVVVRCTDHAGAAKDGPFMLSYAQTAAPIAATSGSGAHLLADRISTAHYTPDPRFADGNGREGPADAETIDRLDIGRYRVSLPNVAPSASSTAQATGFGADDTYATIESWVGNGCGGTYVNVRTYSAAGVPTDAPFSLLYLTDRPAAAQEVAWAWVDPAGQGATFTPWAPRQFSTSGTPITVTRDLVQRNKFIVNFHGFTGTGGAVHASAYGGAHTAVVNTWFPYNNEIRAVVELFDPSGAAANDRAFTVAFRRGGNRDDREAYVWADQPSAASYTPQSGYAWNADRGAIAITRPGIGIYDVRLPGLDTTGLAERGHVQVTPYSQNGLRAKVDYWLPSGADLLVRVRTFDLAGTPTDGRFVLSYNEKAAPIAADTGSGGHVWANDATSALYTPHPNYTDSNGLYGAANAETVAHLGLGHYRVTFPNLDPTARYTAQVTAYGNSPHYASIIDMTPSAGGLAADVFTYDAAGQLRDTRFDLLMLTNAPARSGRPALTDPYGTGCHGMVLTSQGGPISCTDWRLDLNGLPTSTYLVFLQFDLSPASTPLGVGAPGCSNYTHGFATILLLPPLGSPAYGLPIPPGFTGLGIYAQGLAYAPGVNALSLASSNGLLGVIGDR